MIYFLSLFFIFSSLNVKAAEPEVPKESLSSILEFHDDMQGEIKNCLFLANKSLAEKTYIIPVSNDGGYCDPQLRHALWIINKQLIFQEILEFENLPFLYETWTGQSTLNSVLKNDNTVKLGKMVKIDLSEKRGFYHFVINDRLYSAEFEPREELPSHGDPRRLALEHKLGELHLSTYPLNCKEWLRHFPAPVEKANLPAKASLKFILYLLSHEKSFLLPALQQ